MSDETTTSGDDGGKLLYCSFCGKSQHEVRKLIAGPSVFICDECVDLCNDIIREEVQESGSGAQRAGLRPTRRSVAGGIELGDIIVAIDEKEVSSSNDLVLILEKHKAGETVTVTILRSGRRQDLEVTLQD